MPDTRAALTIASEGGNTRFSTNTDSMADVGALMVLSPGSDGIGIGRYCRPWHLQATDWHEAYRIGHLQPGGRALADEGCHAAPLKSRDPRSTLHFMSLPKNPVPPAPMRPLPSLIFASRWLQLPLYLGLILAQAVYVFHFWVELVHLIEAAFGNTTALKSLVSSIGYKSDFEVTSLNETIIMLVVLALIDVVMISNLLIMVIVGGYETFVSRLHLEDHPDQPEWLSHVNASVLKVKLATAIIGISSIHLLKTFINAANYDIKVLMWQTIIHVVFLLSAPPIAASLLILEWEIALSLKWR